MSEYMEKIKGGVCSAKGFQAAGVHCGIRKNRSKRDLALIVSDRPASAAAVYTTNLVKGAPLEVTRKNLADGKAQAIICNSGNANTCNADGIEIAEKMCELTAAGLKINAQDVIVASTGVIGQPLDIAPIAAGMAGLIDSLGADCQNAAEAIMTTDTKMKSVAVAFDLDGVRCHLGGIAKGSGMTHPNMATMLAFLTTDAAVSPALLSKALKDCVDGTFNMISIDGDTSTNDMVCLLANGAAGNPEITSEGKAYDRFCEALSLLATDLCRQIAADGEGATKLLECTVSGGASLQAARKVARSIISSTLLKSAMFGSDANWGRVLCAIGYSGAEVDVTKIDVAFETSVGHLPVCKNGAGIDFSEEDAKRILSEDEIRILIDLNMGTEQAVAWGCDLTYDYVRINGDYRT